MTKRVVLIVWSVVYPLVVLAGAPFWIVKMLRRGGWGSGLMERLGIYDIDREFERTGGVYLHAVSVGEVLMALKVMKRWREKTGDHFILVPTTATGMAVAREKAPEGVRIIYAPLDFGFLIRRVMRRFEPRLVVTVESELWPNLIQVSHGMGIRLGLLNARLSPRSGRRLRRFRRVVAPFLTLLDRVGVPEEGDLERWRQIGVRDEALRVSGNVKFDPAGAAPPKQRPEFAEMLAAFPKKPVAMAVSTFPGEEAYLDEAFREAGYLPVIVPRHAERRREVSEALGGRVVLRSAFRPPEGGESFVIDSTGELRDWTAHADVVVVGKSFFGERGGQNPAEAIVAGVPVICGPHMANFEPLVSELKAVGGIRVVSDRDELRSALREVDAEGVAAARRVLAKHTGAVDRTVEMLQVPDGSSSK